MSLLSGGIRPWAVQRLSAVFMLVAIVLFILKVVAGNIEDFTLWQQWMADPVWNVIIILFWLALFAHAWIGVRDAIMDYVHRDGLRFVVLSLFGFYLIAMLLWMMKIFFMVGHS